VKRTCRTHGQKRNGSSFLGGKRKLKDQQKKLNVGGRVIRIQMDLRGIG
jgi:hypothetical protein